MAATPKLKIFNPKGEYIAACRHAEDAAAIIALNGAGSKIKYDHTLLVWEEGKETQPASESYDFVTETVNARIDEKLSKLKSRFPVKK